MSNEVPYNDAEMATIRIDAHDDRCSLSSLGMRRWLARDEMQRARIAELEHLTRDCIVLSGHEREDLEAHGTVVLCGTELVAQLFERSVAAENASCEAQAEALKYCRALHALVIQCMAADASESLGDVDYADGMQALPRCADCDGHGTVDKQPHEDERIAPENVCPKCEGWGLRGSEGRVMTVKPKLGPYVIRTGNPLALGLLVGSAIAAVVALVALFCWAVKS